MSDKIRIKRGNNAQFTPLVLLDGEPCFVKDTGKLWIGNGVDKTLINPDQGVAPSANKLTTARAITLSGDVTGTVNFDGSANVSIPVVFKNSPVFTGTPKCPTPVTSDNSTSMATTAWVKSQNYSISGSSDIDGGAF